MRPRIRAFAFPIRKRTFQPGIYCIARRARAYSLQKRRKSLCGGSFFCFLLAHIKKKLYLRTPPATHSPEITFAKLSELQITR